MKKIVILLLFGFLFLGCAAGSLRINPEDFRKLQTTETGEPTTGCATANLTGSSGVVGGSSRVVVTWGETTQSIIDWCVGR